jgi:putative transposase
LFIEELMRERGVHVDHSPIYRWVINHNLQPAEAFHRRKRPVWVSWQMDGTYMKVKGKWRSVYRAVEKHGQSIDLLRTEQRDQEAALRLPKQAICRQAVPETITFDGIEANAAAIEA